MKAFSDPFEENTAARLNSPRALWFRATRIGIPLVIMTLLLARWFRIYYWIAEQLNISRTRAYEMIATGTGQQVAQIVLSSFSFIVPFLAVAAVKDRPVREVVAFRRPTGRVMPLFWLGMGMSAFADIAVQYCTGFFEDVGVQYEVTQLKEPPGFWGFILCVVSTAIVPPLVEEFACRGVLFGLLEPYGEGFATMITAILFGIMHGNFDQMPFAFLVGLALGFIRVKTGSLWPGVIIHAANNLFSVIMSQFSTVISGTVRSICMMLFLVISMGLAVVSLIRLRNEKDFFTFKKPLCDMPLDERCVTFFASPTVLFFIVMCLTESISYFVT